MFGRERQYSGADANVRAQTPIFWRVRQCSGGNIKKEGQYSRIGPHILTFFGLLFFFVKLHNFP
jgi:hypothetical protein